MEFTTFKGPRPTYKSCNDLASKTQHAPPLWCLHVDGAANKQGCRAGLILTSPKPKGIIIKYAIHLLFKVTNIEAKYEALLTKLCLAKLFNVKRMHIYSNLQIIIKQVIKEYHARDTKMQAYLEKVERLLAAKEWMLTQILYAKNERVDALAKMTLALPMNMCVSIGLLHKPSIEEAEVFLVAAPSKAT